MIHVFGIPNCDTVKKSLSWLKENKLDFTFHNFKTEGISQKKLKEWNKVFGWGKLLNRKSATWRKLDSAIQQQITSEQQANALMMENTSIIKRPVLEMDGKYLLGFDKEEYETIWPKK